MKSIKINGLELDSTSATLLISLHTSILIEQIYIQNKLQNIISRAAVEIVSRE